MKCCLDCRKLEAEPRGGISAAPDEPDLLLWGWGLWAHPPWWAQGRRSRSPAADQARLASQSQPAANQPQNCCWFCWCLSLVSCPAASRPGRQRPFSVPAAWASGKHCSSVESATCGLKQNLTARKAVTAGTCRGQAWQSVVPSQPRVRASSGPPAPQASLQQPRRMGLPGGGDARACFGCICSGVLLSSPPWGSPEPRNCNWSLLAGMALPQAPFT